MNPHSPAGTLRAVSIDGMTRSAFILRGAMATGALYGAGAVGPYVARAFGQDDGGEGDLEILNFALTLQYLEVEFYKRGMEVGLDGDVKKLATGFLEQEQAHVAAVTQAVMDGGGTPVKEPTFEFPVEDQGSFVGLGMTLEDTGVSAFNGAGPKITNPEVLAAAGTIVQVEGRHAALIRMMRGEDPAPKAFDDALSIPQVRTRVEPFLVG